VTTHSPQVLSTVDKSCIRRLVDDEHGNTVVKIPVFQTKGVTSADILAQIMNTDSVPEVEESHWIDEFSALLQDGK
jgi:predicted ATP-binding protein involved in virulence